jgi:hypothetical protein
MNTLSQLSPPNNNGGKNIGADFPDDIRDLGDRIANLTMLQAKELSDYLEVQGISYELKPDKPKLIPGDSSKLQ